MAVSDESERSLIFVSLSRYIVLDFLDDEVVDCALTAKDTNESLDMIDEKSRRRGGVLLTSDYCSILSAFIDRTIRI
ncbi:hypothetical protein F0562_021385 [Nyssa sinensis]|uniref:Uncharacterized protein n=1 Tax=Nyssa sinensis TaxID=561372 RepID=A0A5J5BLN1_9ASTE|nr:hypothetical protein F0562_021385 [Nyssa sinensis]